MFLLFSEVFGDALLLLPGPPSRPVACAGGQRRLRWLTHKPRPRTARPHQGTGRRWRSGDRPSYLSGPRRKEPRSAAERLLALETKFLLFWAGQEQDSVLSRSAPTRLDCSELRERNLPVAGSGHCLQAPLSVADASGPRRAEETELAHGMVRWSRWKGQTKLAQGMVCWADGRVKPSWRREWSVGPMEGSNQAGAGNGPLDRWKGQTRLADGMVRWTDGKGSDGPLPGFGGWRGALTRSRCREFKGRSRDKKTIGSVQPKLPFPRSIDKVSTGARGVHQATAPSTQLVGCDGDWPACRALSLGTDERVNESWRTALSVGADGRVKPS